MSASHKRREQHLSLIMYRSKTGPPEVIQFIDGCIQGKLDLIAPHVKKKKRRIEIKMYMQNSFSFDYMNSQKVK